MARTDSTKSITAIGDEKPEATIAAAAHVESIVAEAEVDHEGSSAAAAVAVRVETVAARVEIVAVLAEIVAAIAAIEETAMLGNRRGPSPVVPTSSSTRSPLVG